MNAREIKAAYNCRTYVQNVLGQPKKHNAKLDVYLCPFHQEHTASFTVWDDGFKCFGCQRSGSIIDFVMLYDNITFKEAIHKIETGGPSENVRSPEKIKRPQRVIPMSVVEASFSLIHRGLPYYHQRSITDKTAYGDKLGVHPTISTCYQMLDGKRIWIQAERYAIPNIFGQHVRSINYRRNDQAFLKSFHEHKQVFAMLEDMRQQAGHLVLDTDVIHLAGGSKYTQEKGSQWRPFNIQMVRSIEGDQVVPVQQPFILAHAEPKELDTLALMDAGYPTIGLPITASLLEIYPQLFAHIPLLYIIRDRDSVGLTKARSLQDALGRGRIITPPEGYKDTGEVIQAGLLDRWLVSGYGLEPVLR